MSYIIPLRGSEGFLLDLAGLEEHWGKQDYLIIPLLGRVKGEISDFAHLVPCIPKTLSGIDVNRVLERLMKIKVELGYRDGTTISSIDGKLLGAKYVNSLMLEILEGLLFAEPELFSTDLKDVNDLPRFYQCFRTYRKMSATRAT